ncbi:MAG: phage tail family protein [Erysipelotrichaceae bacterium]|nr:phage tail family protein [Erysipelotrichaceae bacterium]
MYDILTFNGKSFEDFNTFWDGSQSLGTPEKDVTLYEVAGRNGSLSISNNRFKNKIVPFNCFIRLDFVKNFSNLMNYLLAQEGYGRLESSTEPDIYRLAQFINDLDPETGVELKSGLFTLNFNCMPQKFLKSGEQEIEIDDAATILNPTMFDAAPLIEVTGTGTININDSVLTLNQNTSTVIIDCQIQDAYEGPINRNTDLDVLDNKWPKMVSGENQISVDGCTIKIKPRWWRI